jgi:3-dehydroquinate synthase
MVIPNARIYAIYRSCINKSQIVADDEKEHGTRALLNLGHTFGHAIESLNDYKKNIIHGEAVSIGIIIATKLSYIDGNIDKTTCDQIINHFAYDGFKNVSTSKFKKDSS